MTPPCPSKTSTSFAFSLNPPLPSFLFHSITPPPPLSLGNYCNGLAVPGGGEEDLVGGQLGERGVGTVRESDLWFSSDMLLAFGTDAHCANGRAPALCSLLFITETTVDHNRNLLRRQYVYCSTRNFWRSLSAEKLCTAFSIRAKYAQNTQNITFLQQ